MSESQAQPEIEGGAGAAGNPVSDRLPARKGFVGVSRTAVRWPQMVVAVFGALMISVIGILIVAAIDPSVSAEHQADRSPGSLLAVQAFLDFGFLLAAIIASAFANRARLGEALRRLGLRSFGPRILLTILIAIVAYAVVAIVVTGIFSPHQEDVAKNLGAGDHSPLSITIIAGILVVPVAAFCEEMFFRGMLFGGLRQSMPLWPAALISGLIFGLLHLTAGDLGVALQLTLFGVILAWAYERSGTLWAPMTLHLINNALAFSFLLSK